VIALAHAHVELHARLLDLVVEAQVFLAHEFGARSWNATDRGTGRRRRKE
jgi:hypothetical protein